MLARDTVLLTTLLASCVFWFVGGLAMAGVNSLGKEQFLVNDLITSTMTATIGLGIAIGAVAAGRLSHGVASPRMVFWGASGLVALSTLLALSPSREWLERASAVVGLAACIAPIYLALAALGASAALFSIPLQVFIQDRPPEGQKGRLIAAMNLLNFVAILISGVVYAVLDAVIRQAGWPRATVFAMIALLMAPVAIWYRPNFHVPRPVD